MALAIKAAGIAIAGSALSGRRGADANEMPTGGVPQMRTTSVDRAALEAFLAHPSRPAGTLSYGELEGFLFALSCAPDLIKPSEWLPQIFGGDSPAFSSEQEAQQILGALMALYNEVNDDVRNGAARVSSDRVFRDDLLANLEPDAPISAWARGFADGHLWLEESWDEYLLEEWEDEFGAFLATLTFFSSAEYAQGFVKELTKDTSLEEIGATFRDLFPEAVRGYAGMGQAIWQARLEMESEVEPQAPAPPTPGRNEPCPCGSGRKFKRCCGGVMH